MIDIIKALILLYACTGIISSMAYLPTIKDQMHGKKSATTSSYLLWTMTGLVSLLYALIIIKDFWLIVVNALSFVFCAIILVLALMLERKN